MVWAADSVDVRGATDLPAKDDRSVLQSMLNCDNLQVDGDRRIDLLGP